MDTLKKIRKIEALIEGAGTEGERQAAILAKERILRTLEERRREHLEARLKLKVETAEPNDGKKNPYTNVRSIDDYLVIPDIQCVGADGKVFEKYKNIYVAKDVVRDGGRHVVFTPYQAISHFEKSNQFLPSTALTCNVLAYCFANRNDKNANKVLKRYKDDGAGYGWHPQNTIIDWKGRKIMHYPLDEKFPNDGGSDGVNQSRQRNEFGFMAYGIPFDNVALEYALKKAEYMNFMINLTGLKNPEVLVEIGHYFNTPARIWFPYNPSDAEHTSASLLGGANDHFNIHVNGGLHVNFAARGVREP